MHGTRTDTKQLKPSIAKPVGTEIHSVTFIEGGLGCIKGIRCAGVSAGFRRNPERKDLALIVADTSAVTAGVFTKNIFCAAPVALSKENLAKAGAKVNAPTDDRCGSGQSETVVVTSEPASGHPGIRAIVLNSGNANASTGAPGREIALRTTQITADALGCMPEQVLVASTGVIGVPLAEAGFARGIPLAVSELGAADGTAFDAGLAAAKAIMTTDTHPKQTAVSFTTTQADGSSVSYRIAGIVKGSGMIQPNMATLLGVCATDAPLTQAAADRALRLCVDATLNKVTVDSDTSTNDSVYLMATGAAGGDTIDSSGPAFEALVEALTILGEDLARQIAYDGEGATKLVTIKLEGAASEMQADLAARAVANSPLVKTAIAGHDANWGRIAMAIGKSGAVFKQENVSIAIMGMPVCANGLPVPFDEDEALRRFEQETEIVLAIDLGAGTAKTTLWTCDLTHGYIEINGDYRT